MNGPIDLHELASSIEEAWHPLDVATANDAIVRMARLDGTFEWHHHDEDEVFLCWEGSFDIELDGMDPVTLHEGGLFVVPRGVVHRPVAREPAVTLLLERPRTRQRGDR